ncbi:MAG: hypothetical protein ACXWID_11015 [Pyrinomonadaceae bacterium]
MSAQQPWTGIQIETSFFPLSFILYACTPTIIIDGQLTRRAWGTHNFPTAGGLHNVRIYFHYLWMQTCGDASINVVVQPNCVHRIAYEMPPWMLSTGAIRELPPIRFQ